LDDLSSGHKESIPAGVTPNHMGLDNPRGLNDLFQRNRFDAVMHFAGSLLVGESEINPGKYYLNNVSGTINLLEAMRGNNVRRFVFSSSAAIFGTPKKTPIVEEAGKNPINTYGRTKLMIEQVLQDYDRAYGLKSVSLRYFNAAGAGDGIGEDHDPETHLIPLVLRSALNGRGLKIFGTDYKTDDGTCVRDYVHVSDLADAHILALNHLIGDGKSKQYNLGSGKGYSVREVINMAREVSRREILVEEVARRAGDPAALVADSSRIMRELGWRPQYGLREIIESAWGWHSNNPNGFGKN